MDMITDENNEPVETFNMTKTGTDCFAVELSQSDWKLDHISNPSAVNMDTVSTTHAQAQSTIQPSSLHCLPNELWIQICQSMDNTTLWASRQICRKMHTIVEDEMMYHRSYLLRLSSRFIMWSQDMRKAYFQLRRLTEFSSINDERVHFEVRIDFFRKKKGGAMLNVEWEDEEDQEDVRRSLTWHRYRKDLLYQLDKEGRASEWPDIFSRCLTLGGRTHTVELPGLEINFENGEMSFFWREFLSDFLSIKRAVRVKRERAELVAKHGEDWRKEMVKERRLSEN
ncbi:hypothetical protein NX059_012000 [Plenodomus lindquistii]|nr:hypothetical protein NX059_012000 [Plenodomus lindquistii]